MIHLKNKLLKYLFEDWGGSEGGKSTAAKAFGEHLLCARMLVRTSACAGRFASVMLQREGWGWSFETRVRVLDFSPNTDLWSDLQKIISCWGFLIWKVGMLKGRGVTG